MINEMWNEHVTRTLQSQSLVWCAQYKRGLFIFDCFNVWPYHTLNTKNKMKVICNKNMKTLGDFIKNCLIIPSAKISKHFTFYACGHNILLSHIKEKLLLPLKLDIYIKYRYDIQCRMKTDKSQHSIMIILNVIDSS